MNSDSFAQLTLSSELLDNLGTLGYHQMTPIQAASLPPILAGRDVIAQAKTGSGKTAAFGLGLLALLDAKHFRVQALVLCPTRELADQVANELRRLARGIHNVKILTLCGGAPFGPQIHSLEHGAHIIVGTPGRVEEHLRKAHLSLADLRCFVLDEADRMLDMGFRDSLQAIMGALPGERQNLLFSATWPEEMQRLAERLMRQPVRVEVDQAHDSASIAQHFYELPDNAQRLDALRRLLLAHRPGSTLVFCNTKRETDELAEALRAFGFVALALHGDLEQKERDQILVRFVNKSASILVATDVAARGLDIDAMEEVINYYLPRDLDVYIHRMGRTGRAGDTGRVCSLFTTKERYRFESLQRTLGQAFELSALPPPAVLKQPPFKPPMQTLQIDGGRKQKLRPGDILGALTGEHGLNAEDVGKIQITAQHAFVAVKRSVLTDAESRLREGKLKGRSFRVRRIT